MYSTMYGYVILGRRARTWVRNRADSWPIWPTDYDPWPHLRILLCILLQRLRSKQHSPFTKFPVNHEARFSVEHEASLAVVQGRRRGPKMGSLKNTCRTSCWSSVYRLHHSSKLLTFLRKPCFVYCGARGEVCCRSRSSSGSKKGFFEKPM